LDGFAKDSAQGFYKVVSLYYDSPTFYYYHQKIDGTRNRKKFRLRTYCVDGSFAKPIFFEIKRKFDSVILKDRFLLDMPLYEDFIKDGRFAGMESRGGNSTHVAEEYEETAARRSLGPKVLITYRREPYLGAFNKNFRITFDYDIKACEGTSLFEKKCDTPVLADGVIMEIKFNGRLPHYIKEIIDGYNLERVAYSKYCHAVEACYALPYIAAPRNYFFNIDQPLLMQPYERII